MRRPGARPRGLGERGALAGRATRSLADEEFGAAAGDEDPWVHGDPQTAELGPADDMFEGLACGPPFHHVGEIGRRRGRGDEQLCLVLSEDTASGPEPGDDDGLGRNGR